MAEDSEVAREVETAEDLGEVMVVARGAATEEAKAEDSEADLGEVEMEEEETEVEVGVVEVEVEATAEDSAAVAMVVGCEELAKEVM